MARILWCEGPQWGERSPEDWPRTGRLPPGSKIVIHALRERGHQVDVRLWGEARPVDGHDVIMIAVMFVRQYPYLRALFDALGRPVLRRDDPPHQVPIVIGGHGVYQPRPLQASATRLVIGDGERIAPDLADDIESWDGTPHVFRHDDPPRDHEHRSERPSPLLFSQYYGIRTVEIARGCPYRCRFCEMGWNHKYTPAPKAQVFDALDQCERGDHVHMMAADATSWPWYGEAVEHARSRGLVVNFNSMRVDSSGRQSSTSGSARFGIEGPSEAMRERLGKPITTQAIIERITTRNEAGVHSFRLFFMWDLPGCDEDDWDELWSWLDRIRLPRGGQITTKFTGWLPMPGTPMASEHKRFSVDEYAMLMQRLDDKQSRRRALRSQSGTYTREEMMGVPSLRQQKIDVRYLRAETLEGY